jgi:hypothetical protein
MEWQKVFVRAVVCCLLSSVGTAGAFAADTASARECPVAILAQVKRIADLVRSRAGGVDEAKRLVLSEFEGITPEELEEAIQHEVRELEKVANGISNGPTGADIQRALAALAFARQHGLKIEAALMKAVKEGNGDVVEGFMVMILHGNGICDEPGYARFCKKIDMAAGWMGENYVVEAGKTSLRAAKALIRAGAEGPLDKLVVTKFGAQASAVAIEQGKRASFPELIPLENETAAVSLIELGLPFTATDLRLAIEHGKNEVFEAALRHHPELASGYHGDGFFPLYDAVNFDRPQMAFTLLKTYKVNPNQRLRRERNFTALMHASALGRNQVLRILLSEGADPNLTTDIGMTALLLAASGPSVSLLLDAGADPDLGLSDGWKPIHKAVFDTLFDSSYLSHVKELVLAGADVNAVATRTLALDYSRLYKGGATAHAGPEVTPLAIVAEFIRSSGLDPQTNAQNLKTYLAGNGAK